MTRRAEFEEQTTRRQITFFWAPFGEIPLH
jgi:hypothetical protein